MSVVSFVYDLWSKEVSVVPNMDHCMNCSIRNLDWDNAKQNIRCLCWNCIELGVSGVQYIVIDYDDESKSWVYFNSESSIDYKLSEPWLRYTIDHIKKKGFTLVPTGMCIDNNCGGCNGNGKNSKAFSKQRCWECASKGI